MLRVLCLLCVLSVSWVLTACDFQKSTVGFVNTGQVFNDSLVGKSAASFLQGQQKYLESEFAQAQKLLAADAENVEMQQYVAKVHTILQQRLKAEQQNVANILNACLQRIVKDYREEKGLTFIASTQSVINFDASVDITEEILAIMDKEIIQFSAVTEGTQMPSVPSRTSEKPADK